MRRPPTFKKLAQLLIPTVAAAGLGLTLLAPNGGAAPAGSGAGAKAPKPAPRSAPAPQPASATVLATDLAPGHPTAPAQSATKAAQRPPLAAAQNAAERKKARSAAKGAADCNVSDFTSKTGAELVEQIKQSETTCINTLFTVTGEDSKALFREEQMVTVANALKDVAANYPGDNSTSTAQVVLYLRAGYYIQYNQPDNVGKYGPELKSAIEGALDAFFGSSHAFDVTEANGDTLAETVTLIDSSAENARYLNVVKRLQKDYDASYDKFYGMLAAVNNTYTVLFRGHQLPEFVKAVKADPSVLTGLRDFAVAHDDLLGTDKAYLASNAGRELGRFLQHADLKDTVKPLVKELLGRSKITGRTAPLWVGLAEMTNEFDKANCADYDTCDLQNRVRDAVLTIKHKCGPSAKILAQELTESELSATCNSILKQNPVFHDIVKDNGPVKDDKNTNIEIVAFNSSTDYKTYAGVIFGIDTNNGGMYVEGDPAAEGNQPRFIAYEQPADDGAFQIWNLNHEYTHYLDGRFDMYGDFAAGQTTPAVMWIEGFAEYVSYTYRDVTYDRAIEEAGKGTYKLSQLFETTYNNTDTTRTYQWGYLGVRYMLQSHPEDVTTLLGHYRAGEYDAAYSLLHDTIGTKYDADFADWLSKCADGDCGKLPARSAQ
ncbi:collagenase [Streptomyces chattanoogensis]|uniref:microbial collagenase n=1 Tax=Streptomyces chattanoogensis TaxID=66876 RepID=A0A0N0H1B3_9ACTN|nr:collagenase [Streptomyces chattanoogensis]KPC64351.1 protease [Streptomyces chattanoogensis]